MKNKKNFTLQIALVVLMMVGMESCSLYPDNQGITLVSRIDRLSTTWKVENYKLNGTDYTSLVTGYTETYTKQGAYSYQWGIFGGTGTWVFQSNDAQIKITGVSNQADKTLFILRLEATQFWYYYMDGTDKKEYHLIK